MESTALGLIPERLISQNPGSNFAPLLVFTSCAICLEKHFVLTYLYLRVRTQQYLVRLSYMFIHKKTVLKIWLNLDLNFTIFRGTGLGPLLSHIALQVRS